MKKPELTDKELSILCRLYLSGQLNRKEEKMLFAILSNSQNLHDECKEVLRLMSVENRVFAKPKRSGTKLFVGLAAASVTLIAIIAGLQFLNRNQRADTLDNDTYVVLQNGTKLTGPEAQRLAEERQKEDMETLRIILREQRKSLKLEVASAEMDKFE